MTKNHGNKRYRQSVADNDFPYFGFDFSISFSRYTKTKPIKKNSNPGNPALTSNMKKSVISQMKNAMYAKRANHKEILMLDLIFKWLAPIYVIYFRKR